MHLLRREIGANVKKQILVNLFLLTHSDWLKLIT